MEDLEKKLIDMHDCAATEMSLQHDHRLEEGISPSGKALSIAAETAEKEALAKASNAGQEMKGALARHELILNDLNLRLSVLETGMQKIEPNNMRALFRDIAELVMQEEKKEVSAVVDGLKGSQQRHTQLVEGLKQNLKELDERFKSDIDRKIEKKDLNTAKNQLRRKVIAQLISLASRTRNENEGKGWRFAQI